MHLGDSTNVCNMPPFMVLVRFYFNSYIPKELFFLVRHLKYSTEKSYHYPNDKWFHKLKKKILWDTSWSVATEFRRMKGIPAKE